MAIIVGVWWFVLSPQAAFHRFYVVNLVTPSDPMSKCLFKSDKNALVDVSRPTASAELFDHLLAKGAIDEKGCPKAPLTEALPKKTIVFFNRERMLGELQGSVYLAKSTQNLGHWWLYMTQNSYFHHDWHAHMKWIKENPQKANDMAREANRISNELFAGEMQIQLLLSEVDKL